MLSRASIVASFNNALSPASVGSFHSQLQSGKRQLIEPVYKNMPRLICVIFSYDTQQCRLCYTQSTQPSTPLSIQSGIQEPFANSNKQHFSTPSSILNAFNNHNVR
jgi:hypothetical protein